MPQTQPQAVGLYDPTYEHDACGVAFVARLDAEPTHEVVRRAIVALANLDHRGAEGADPSTGDGAGMLLQMPDALFREVVRAELPPEGRYGVGVRSDPTYEHDACGGAFVARLDAEPTHEVVRRAIVALANLDHRGAEGADPSTGDGAGMLLQMPDALFREVVRAELPPEGRYGVGV